MASLSTVPVIAKQWHSTRNPEDLFEQVGTGSKRKVWWLGDCGHEWEASIAARVNRNSGCPYCAGQKVLAGFNDLATVNPELAAEWHPTRNAGVLPSEVSAGSRMKKFWWLGDCGHEWESNVLNRVQGNGCYQCLGRKKTASQGYLKDDPILVNEFDNVKNIDVDVNSLRKFSLIKVWWVGERCGHSWLTSVSSRSSGHGCPVCAGNEVSPGVNDFATTHPELSKEWHPTLNGSLSPDTVVAGSKRKVWWLGDCGHEWEASLSGRAGLRNHGCPYCSGKKVLVGFNDLASQAPYIASQWNEILNPGETPDQVHYGARRKFWWVCDKGHEWEALLSNRVTVNSGCPTCYASTFVSKAEHSVADYVSGLGFSIQTSVRNLIKGELDIYVPAKNIAIEFNGLYWHSEANGKGKTYHYDKWKACKDKGIQLIQVWEDDWNRNPELVKRMIAHKLGMSEGIRVFARKTSLSVPESGEVKRFLEHNHLQGYRAAKYFGLKTSGDDLVAVLGVQKKGLDGLEIIRFATYGSVPGGFTKLLKHVLNHPNYVHVEKVYSYSHNDHSDGGVYEKNGFENIHTGSPGYAYWSSGWTERQNRLKFAPSRIKNNPEMEYVEGATERELAELNNLTRVWDSGSSLWVKTINR